MKPAAFVGVVLILSSFTWYGSYADRRHGVLCPAEDTLKQSRIYVKQIFRKVKKYNRQSESIQKRYIKRIEKEEMAIHTKLNTKDRRLSDYVFSNSIINPEFKKRNDRIGGNEKCGKCEKEKIRFKPENDAVQGVSQGYIESTRKRTGWLRHILIEQNPSSLQKRKKIKMNKLLGRTDAELLRAEENLKKQNEINSYTRKRKVFYEKILAEKPGLKKELTIFKKDAFYSKSEFEGAFQRFKTALPIEKNLERVFSNTGKIMDTGIAEHLTPVMRGGQTEMVTGGTMMQTINEANQLIRQSIEASGAETIIKNIQRSTKTVSEKLGNIKKEAGSIESMADIPDFKVNPLRTKRFVERIRYGITLQIMPGTYKTPLTGEAGISAGYMITMKFTAGVLFTYRACLAERNNRMSYNYNGWNYGGYAEYQLKGMIYGIFNMENSLYSRADKYDGNTEKRWKTALMAGLKLKKKAATNKRAWSMTIYYDFLNNKMPYTQPLVYRAEWEF